MVLTLGRDRRMQAQGRLGIPRAQCAAPGAGEAEPAMRSGADGEAPLAGQRSASAQLALQSNEIRRGENRRDRLVRAGEEPMDDLDAKRAMVQGGKGIDE